MHGDTAPRVRRVEVTDPIATACPYDYADAFAVDLPEPDGQAPEAWVRDGLGGLPPIVDWVARLLGMRPSADPLGGWRIRESGPAVIHLEQSLSLMDVVAVGRRVGPTRRMFTSVIRYRRPLLARLAWAVIAPAHRRMARRAMLIGLPAPESGRAADPAVGA